MLSVVVLTQLRLLSPQHLDHCDDAYSLSIRVQTTLNHIRFVKSKNEDHKMPISFPEPTCLLVSTKTRSVRILALTKSHVGSGNEIDKMHTFRSEKRNRHARVLTVRQASSLKKWREFRRSCKQKRLRTLYAFPIFLVSSNILTSLMKSWYIVFFGNQFFWDKINLKTVPEPFIFPRYTRNFVAKKKI